MNKEELIEFLSENLQISVNDCDAYYDGGLEIKLLLCGEEIDNDYFSIKYDHYHD